MQKRFLFFFLMFLPCILPGGVFASNGAEINTATVQQLDEITGIGPVLAQRIIDARPFSSVDDLLRVKGIGEKTLQKIKDQGLAYIEEQSQQPTQETTQNSSPNDQKISTTNQTLADSPGVRPPLTYPRGIVFSDILPSPEGADETEEYIKIYNKNAFDVDLTGWKIKDAVGSSTTYAFPETKITAKAYLVLMRPDTKITLNNSGDKITLFNPNNEIADAVEYSKAPTGEPYKITNAGWQWNGGLTIAQKNNTNKGKESEGANKEKFLADLSQSVSFDNKSFLYLILVAGAMALVSTIVIIFLKRKLIK